MKPLCLSLLALAASTMGSFAGTDMGGANTTTDTKEMLRVSPGLRSDAGFYVAALGGVNFDTDYGNHLETLTFNTTGRTLVTHQGIASNDWGGVGGIKVGYNFPSFPITTWHGLSLQPAAEAEALYIGTDLNRIRDPFGGGATVNFSTTSGAFFLNGILRFKNDSIVTPYIGAGPGLQYITTHGDFVGNPGDKMVTGVNTDDLDFAAQALVGCDVQICQHVSLFTEYKFIDAIGTDGKPDRFDGGNETYRFKPDQIQQNLITAGVKYSF